ncbi:MAG: hypothetical protein AAGI23_22245 [Bacteroidota bacterium]
MLKTITRFFCLVSLLFIYQSAHSNIPPGDGKVYVFLDCSFCNQDQIRQELNYLNFANDAYRSNVQVLINRTPVASGAQQYNLEIIGRSEWEGEKVSFTFNSTPTMTTFEQNELILKKIELGLAPFLAKTYLSERVRLSVERVEEEADAVSVQPYESFWKNWIYELGSSARWNSESIRSNFNFRADMDIDNVTPEWRIRIRPFYNYRQQNVETSDGEAVVIRRRAYFSGSVVRSISDHWSVGVFNSYYHSNYSNINLDAWIAPAIEYSIFSYDEVPMKEFTVAYRIGYLSRNYIETTVFDLLEEDRYRQMLDVDLRLRRPWGNVFVGASASNFLHDFTKNRVSLNGRFSIRVYKGLSVTFGGNYELINDQLSLPKGELSLEDLLLAQRQVATDFEAGMNFGINYTFGALYNNIVNTRL